MRDASLLRYPGGKWRIAKFFEGIIRLNRLKQCQYVEPYAGGAGLALSLLFREKVAEIHLNDLDPAIYAFWYSVLNQNAEFKELLDKTAVTPDEWARQKDIYFAASTSDKLTLGFATFFLNRTNHSGIMNGGMIGGKEQRGEWKLDARYHKANLQSRLNRIGQYRNRIHLTCLDALDFLREHEFGGQSLAYLDPPYFKAGKRLYLNAYNPEDHAAVSDCIKDLSCPWVVSYDDVREIRKLYSGIRSRRLSILHTAREAKNGNEVLYFSPGLRIPASTR